MRRLARPVAILAALVVLASSASAQTPGDLQADLAEREQQRSEATRQLEETRAAEGTAQERLAAADAELEAAQEALAAAERAMADAETRRDEAREAAAAARTQLRQVNEELAETEAELEVIQEQFDLRVVGSFKRGATRNEFAIVQQMLAAEDIADAMSRQPFLSAVMDADRQLVDQVRALVDEVEAQRAEAARLRVLSEGEAATAEEAAAEVAEQLSAQERLTAEVAQRRAARDRALEDLRNDRGAIEAHLAGLDAESQRIEDQLAAIAAQQAAEAAEREAAEAAAREAEAAAERQRAEEAAAAEAASDSGSSGSGSSGSGSSGSGSSGSGSSGSGGSGSGGSGSGGSGSGGGGDTAPPPSTGGGWTRPTSGPVTSHFGPRWGRMHNGVDIGAPVGTGVVASRGGTVVHVTSSCHPTSSQGCGGGFGNYVTVSHDGGMATIYAHLSSVNVGNGQSVSAGQSIGAVGNSGNSTGAHLHFEVRRNGSPQNPCNYISC